MRRIGIFCLVFAFSLHVKSFPTSDEKVKASSTSTPKTEESTFTLKQSDAVNPSSISTTSSLLFKDKKPILTYLLGQPKKQGGISSPAQLLSPDRYEFFTFDDDGQIVKKLMSVREIQKIIANNEKGSVGEQGTPVEYYQILTVTPDVESLPSVSRINPNEPLFSIHDVIASVQNVLKSEMKIKHSQSVPVLNSTNFVASASNDHFEIITEQPPVTFKVEVQKLTPSAPLSTTPPDTFVLTQEGKSEPDEEFTKRPDSDYTILTENVSTPGTKQSLSTTITHIPVPLLSSPATSKPIKEAIDVAASTYKIVNEVPANVPVPQSKPLSLSDAHPGFISNESFLDMKPITVEQISKLTKPIILEVKKDPSENFVKVETVDKNSVNLSSQSTKTVETSTANVDITPDLADSVSSVLWQIASENSMLSGLNKATEATSIKTETSSNAPVAVDSSAEKTASSPSTTEMPVQSRSTVKEDKPSESPLVALGSILIPQNRPRPFQKVPLIQKNVSEAAESRTEPIFLTTISDSNNVSSSTTVSSTKLPEVETKKNNEENKNVIVTKESSSTVVPQVVSLSPDAVVQSPENLKPVTEKVNITNNNSNQNLTQQTLEGVHVIQEANIGQIPRTTEYPGQVVKEIQRMETPNLDETDETLSNSASNTFSTQLPYVFSEETTVTENTEEVTETATESETDSTEAHTESNIDVAEVKLSEEELKDQKQTSSSDRVDITFVPMLIKTPSAFKQEILQKAESQIVTEKAVEENTEQVDVTEKVAMKTSIPNQDTFESKELPEETIESKNAPMTTESVLRETVQADDFITEDDVMPSLKQNIQIKPFFGKPQKPSYTKPVKSKPQPDTKTTKPPFVKGPQKESETKKPFENHLQSSPTVLELDAAPDENLGLEATVVNLDGDVKRFTDLCNELAFSLWSSVTHNGLSFVRSIVVSPFAVTSLLAMVFLGARGPTSGQMNDVLKLDDMVTFNPHLVFRNVTESLVISRNPGVATAAFVRELYSDKAKGKLLDFYKERVQQFYDGHVEEVNFKTIGDTLRRQTNHLVKRQTWGKITDFLRGSNLMPRPPLAAFSANIFQTDCTRASTKDRDGEMYFVILPASRLRRLVPIPAVVWRDSFLAGYEPNLDATAVSINPSDSAVSTIFVLPGQQGLIAPGDTLARLEHHLLGSPYKKGHWSRLMRSLLPRPGLELQIPRLSHKSVINVTSSLQRMGLKDLFSADKADLTGLNGLANDLHLSDMLQVNLFSTCGEEPIGARHHSEVYPATPILRQEKSSENIFSDSVDNLFGVSDFEDPAISALPLELRPRQARVPLSAPGVRIPEPPRLRFDRPFLFFVRHNPTGLILHMGRFNPRLMP